MAKPRYIIFHAGAEHFSESSRESLDELDVIDGDTVFEISRAWKVTQPKIKFEKLEE